MNSKEENIIIRTNIVGQGGLLQWALTEAAQENKIFGFTNSYFNPVHVKQLSKFIYKSVNLDYQGTYNVFGNLEMSKYDFLKKVFLKKGINLSLLGKKRLKNDENLVYHVKNKNGIFLSFSECMEEI